MKTLRIILISCLISLAYQVKAKDFPYRHLSPIPLAPSEVTTCMFFDKDGLMWIGTDAGVKSYDGYQIKTYKASVFQPGILPNNTIRSLAEDHNDNLWLGTRNGLVRMNKKTGDFKTFQLPKESQRIIYTLYVGKDGTLWVGTDGGLSYFDAKNETFYTYDNQNSWLIDEYGRKSVMCNYSVKAIVEDRNGDLLLGTWSAGLLRLHRGSQELHRYPKLNNTNSAYSLFVDKHQRLWVGTWGYGVLRIDNPSNVKHPLIKQYPYDTSNFDTYYKFVEDPVSGMLWACTREGVCYLDEENPLAEWQRYTQIGTYPLNFNNDIATDGQGNIWLCTQNSGIMQVNTIPSAFHLWNLGMGKVHFPINYINSLLTTDGEWFWIGLNPYGIALFNRKTGATYYNQEIPGFSNIPSRTFTTSVSNICRRNNGDIWFSTNSYGIIVKPLGGRAYVCKRETHPSFIREDFVNTTFCSTDHTMWIGHRSGLSVVFPNDKGYIITGMKDKERDFTHCDIRHISEDKQGNIWLATDNEGIIRISGNPRQPRTLKYKQYNPTHHNFAINDATTTLEDSKGRLWAISNSGGLLIYNKEKDRFDPKNRDFHLPGDRALAIQEDPQGDLWLTTDKALVHFVWGGKESAPTRDSYEEERPKDIIFFTKEDGLGDMLFSDNSTCKYGEELFFGSRTSFISFVPTPKLGLNNHRKSKLIITDMLIDDLPFAQLDSASKVAISKETPTYTRHITLPSHIKKLDIKFSLLTYGNATKNQYAYLLDGYDDNWQYCNSESHKAIFQNLPSGSYRLHVKATDGYGKWQEMPYTITIKVLPPWYASRLAYIAYILIFIGVVFGVAHWYKEHVKTKNRLQMGVILTNITHELLTPLTVISATIYKLKKAAPQYEEDYLVMDSNIDRSTRLLRQILEVRKSQAGQLRLLVSRSNLSGFVEKACENIRPMAEHRHITLTFKKNKDDDGSWFDADKLDKILYNLLSNAIKYNKESGKIDVQLKTDKEKATITIADNGIGMSKEKQKHLYTRFFDGDYRKQNMPGTGIGLSLTHDLVKLHHGSINCESQEGVGTTFTLTIPIRKSAYSEMETEDENKNANKKTILQTNAGKETEKQAEKEDCRKIPAHQSVFVRKNVSKILVVEDNEELLALMLQVLSKNYHVFTAKNGKQALNVINKQALDLVVSDVMMPVMDGIELTKAIKSDDSFCQLPIILLTAKNKEEDKTEGYANGADAYVAKPFKFEELEVRINSLLLNRKRIIEKIETEQALMAAPNEEEAKKKLHMSNPDQAFVTRATKVVMEHLSDADYDRQSFATDMAMGESSLYAKVKSTTGQTVIGFITSIRMKEAKRIMQQDPDILISEVAAKVGFNTPKYFSKCFKKEFGMFPKEFAEEVKNKR